MDPEPVTSTRFKFDTFQNPKFKFSIFVLLWKLLYNYFVDLVKNHFRSFINFVFLCKQINSRHSKCRKWHSENAGKQRRNFCGNQERKLGSRGRGRAFVRRPQRRGMLMKILFFKLIVVFRQQIIVKFNNVLRSKIKSLN